MSAGGWFDNLGPEERLRRLTAEADGDRLAAAAWQPGRWRCRIGLHNWRAVETADHDKYAECTRCGKRDWRRLLGRASGKWGGGSPMPGSENY